VYPTIGAATSKMIQRYPERIKLTTQRSHLSLLSTPADIPGKCSVGLGSVYRSYPYPGTSQDKVVSANLSRN
jgi:hypothetical protein